MDKKMNKNNWLENIYHSVHVPSKRNIIFKLIFTHYLSNTKIEKHTHTHSKIYQHVFLSISLFCSTSVVVFIEISAMMDEKRVIKK